jgi:choline dehydrogenase-like flavoprotein
MTYAPALFAEAAGGMGLHPFPHPAGNLSKPYTNPYGAQLGACTFCGFCEKFGCGNYSKASPQTTLIPYIMQQPNFALRTECEVLKIEKTPDGKQATGVTYIDSAGTEYFQPASIVVLTAYQLHNVHLLLLSGIGKPYDPKTGQGVVGKNYCYQTMSSVEVFFEDKLLNPFIGAGALASVIDDYNGDNFDHSGRRRVYRRPCHRCTAHRDGACAQRCRQMGFGLEKGRCKVLPAEFFHLGAWFKLCAGRQLSRSRSELPRPIRASDAAHDVRLSRQRHQDGEVLHRPRRRCRQGDGSVVDHAQGAEGAL